MQLGFVASLATKLSDTFASEVGKVLAHLGPRRRCEIRRKDEDEKRFWILLACTAMPAYGKTTYLITSLERVSKHPAVEYAANCNRAKCMGKT
eukprot:1967879-Rhodomonas_salina.1